MDRRLRNYLSRPKNVYPATPPAPDETLPQFSPRLRRLGRYNRDRAFGHASLHIWMDDNRTGARLVEQWCIASVVQKADLLRSGSLQRSNTVKKSVLICGYEGTCSISNCSQTVRSTSLKEA